MTCYKCNGKGHYANDCNFSKNRIAPELSDKSEYLTRGTNNIDLELQILPLMYENNVKY